MRTREKRLAQNRAYYAAHKEKILARSKAYNAAHKEEIIAWHKAWYDAHKEEQAAWMKIYKLKQNFGLTLAEYDKMLESQGGVCKICGGVGLSGKRLSVDHDHETGKVRGLLCSKCNTAIGLLDDDPKTFLKASLYLMVRSK
jgi:uncharacterized protein GlcG (DUF336 family)